MRFKLLWICVNITFMKCVLSQELNVIPNLLRPYFWHTNEHVPINLMANISEKLFHFKKFGIQLGV